MQVKTCFMTLSLLLSTPAMAQTTLIQGTVANGGPVRSAEVTVIDKNGSQQSTKTDQQGRFSLDASSLQAPLLLSSVDPRLPDGKTSHNCLNSDTQRARCMASVLPQLHHGKTNVANITPFTDRLVSEIAVSLKFIGPQQWIESGSAEAMKAELLQQPLAHFHAGMDAALTRAGIQDAATFNPISTPMQANGQGIDAILLVINHNRGYDNNSGQAGETTLSDISFRPLVGLTASDPYEPFDYTRAKKEREAIIAAKTRVLIVGDSTAATYEVSRLPRMGWGQVFQQRFRDGAQVQVLNGARSGRSSRDFYNEGWYQQMARFIKPGDVVLIDLGHNDENCNAAKPIRGAADVKNLCSYPNDAQGMKQYPAGQPKLSFQNALENYINLAREKGATPILMTPTTRFTNADRKQAFKDGDTRPVISSHYTRQNSANGYAFTGDYSATIKKTAQDKQVPLIDLEQLTIDFANHHASDWTSYWLAIDPNDSRYPYYKTQTAGVMSKPDTTHFQQKGAEAVAELVAGAIKQNTQLTSLAGQLN
ncbi:SGNH/GDSL hydrolase family protein [Acerihabitans sp. TG2]|uniref:SGNH/GDSL hydrolase family protein n=1 Tax=Acerihabitans sp. TG2 TaxID=3096008 RepID=UPI002B239054|nr:SGNH/GDSL hydrolase family protein [Acerihabitans sp. TG2]MEA9391310.1 SGNH/GDSL hydrolase family protein [Acerihabitans sp. TG2]